MNIFYVFIYIFSNALTLYVGNDYVASGAMVAVR